MKYNLKSIRTKIRSKISTVGKSGERLGFYGEFGFFLVNWLPYLNYIKQQGIHLKTVGPVGSAPFYYFSDDHIELDCPHSAVSFGTKKGNAYIQTKIDEILVAPCKSHSPNVSYHDIKFLCNKTHATPNRKNYCPPKIGGNDPSIAIFPELKPDTYVVISNKTYVNWGIDMENYFKADEVERLIDLITSYNLHVVFNNYGDNDANDLTAEKAANKINANQKKGIYSAQEAYSTDRTVKNEQQIALLKNAKFLVSVQGGGSYLASIFGKPNYVLQRAGMDYNNLKTLSENYNTKLRMFYHVDNLLETIEKTELATR